MKTNRGKCSNQYQNVPQVDETPEYCDGNIYGSECIYLSQSIEELGLRKGDSLAFAIKKISAEIEKLNNKIYHV